jgi:hypothetical protein
MRGVRRRPSPAPRPLTPMKRLIVLLLGAGLFCGCAHHYDMTLTNGMRIINVRKAAVNKATGQVDYTDVAGHKRHISLARVVLIEPHNSKQFISPTEQ